MTYRIWIGLAAAAAVAVGGFGAGHYVAVQQEEKRVETCAEAIALNDVSKCPKRISDAFSTLSLGPLKEALAGRDASTGVAGRSYAADIARLERLKDDLAALANQPVTSQCGASPAMQELRAQICREVGGCEP